MKKLKHGGARTGAGKPRIDKDVQKRRNVSLSDKTVKKAKRIGKGNISEGIRTAVDGHKL